MRHYKTTCECGHEIPAKHEDTVLSCGRCLNGFPPRKLKAHWYAIKRGDIWED